LSRWDGRSGPPSFESPAGVPATVVGSVTADAAGRVWFTMNGGVYRLSDRGPERMVFNGAPAGLLPTTTLRRRFELQSPNQTK
jgi:hypothetical protein